MTMISAILLLLTRTTMIPPAMAFVSAGQCRSSSKILPYYHRQGALLLQPILIATAASSSSSPSLLFTSSSSSSSSSLPSTLTWNRHIHTHPRHCQSLALSLFAPKNSLNYQFTHHHPNPTQKLYYSHRHPHRARSSSSSSSLSTRTRVLSILRGGGTTIDDDNNNNNDDDGNNFLNIFPLPSSFESLSHHNDVNVALLAVLASCRVTRLLQPAGNQNMNMNAANKSNGNGNGIDTLSKVDDSPVTIGDFASQAIALQILHNYFPGDVYLAEEGSEALRPTEKHDTGDDDGAAMLLLDKVWMAVNQVCDSHWSNNGGDNDVNKGAASTTVWGAKEELLNAIDFGQGIGTPSLSRTISSSSLADGVGETGEAIQSSSTKRRVWSLDPIDGTKGFLRGRTSGGQYCVALALLEDGAPVVSVLGCPNMPLHLNGDGGDNDCDAAAADIVGSCSGEPYGVWSEEEIARDAHRLQEQQQQEQQERTTTTTTTTSGSKHEMFSATRGCVFVAVHGRGCYEIPLHALEKTFIKTNNKTTKNRNGDSSSIAWAPLHVTSNDGSSKQTSQGTFCLGVERGFSDPKGTVLEIAKRLHGADGLVDTTIIAADSGDGATATTTTIPDIQNSIRMDGQGKYGILARGNAEYFLRLPKDGYVDWIWDVAAGYLVLTEAGGKMTDVYGCPIDFSGIGIDRMAKLPEDVKGIFGTCGGVFHDALVEAYAEVEKGMGSD